jgi:hypothetical protein
LLVERNTILPSISFKIEKLLSTYSTTIDIFHQED